MTKFTLHSITLEDSEGVVLDSFNNSESFYDYMRDLAMDSTRDDDEGLDPDYINNIHVYYNVMLQDNEIHGLTQEEYRKLLEN